MSEKRTIVTGPDTVFSYLHVLQPRAISEGAEAKYSVSLIIPKSDTETIQKIQDAILAAYEEGESKLRGNGRTVPPLKDLKIPLKDGDRKVPDDPAYHGAYYINASNKEKPKLFNARLEEITDPGELYSGVTGRAQITFYAYNKGVNRGIGCALDGLKKLRDGEPLGGHTNVKAAVMGLDDDLEDDFLA